MGYIERLTHRVGQRAWSVLDKLSRCRQKVAQFLLYDETFPKMSKRIYSLGVAICEYGLIRSVRCIRQKAMENFDVKTRGLHQGTSAMQRAEINLEDLGATDFFSAVGPPKPQISFSYVTD